MKGKYDFSGWATKNDLRCSDGRTIRHNAFEANDGQTVPLVWQHQHKDPDNVLGHAMLENRDEGVYAYGVFNNTPKGLHAKELVQHGDIKAMSIYANNLKQKGGDVLHGMIREVSLVLSPANPGAMIEYPILEHSGEEVEDEAVIYTGEEFELFHSDYKKEDEKKKKKVDEEEDEEDSKDVDDEEETDEESDDEEDKEMDDDKKKLKHAEDDSKESMEDVYNTLNEKQKDLVHALVGMAASGGEDKEEEGETEMKHNLFDTEEMDDSQVLTHSDMQEILSNAKRVGSLREAIHDYEDEHGAIMHSTPMDGMVGPSSSTIGQKYGFRDPDMLFPEYRSLNNPPEWISRNMDWVSVVMGAVHHTPFSRIKSQFADITEDEARAKGYIKGHQKKDEVFTLLKRTTDPQTIYKRQKMDRDDIIDITDFDVVSWIRAEMRVMLNEEIARAILIGDGRLASSDDKIQEAHIRPIVSDVPLFNVKVPVTKSSKPGDEGLAETAKNTINAVIRSRKEYKGSGNPIFFTTEDTLTEMLLIEDGIGHKLYKTEAELATALRVSRIVTVEVMEGHNIQINSDKYPLVGVIVNLNDYNVGTDKGGEINLFDDFDIDYNQYKYLIETRMSGALVKPFSALTVYLNAKVTEPAG